MLIGSTKTYFISGLCTHAICRTTEDKTNYLGLWGWGTNIYLGQCTHTYCSAMEANNKTYFTWDCKYTAVIGRTTKHYFGLCTLLLEKEKHTLFGDIHTLLYVYCRYKFTHTDGAT